MNVREELEARLDLDGALVNDVEVNAGSVKVVMINEVVPPDPSDDFYSGPESEYAQSAGVLFERAGTAFSSPADALAAGIYLTNAIKWPKEETTVPKELVERSIPVLEAELSLFPRVEVVMLMGDVAKKCFNAICKKQGGRNAVPSGSTYKLRSSEITYDGKRVMPSYIMIGGNIQIEKSKVQMITEDIAEAIRLIGA